MIAQGMAVLLHYTAYVAPGVLLLGLWFVLTPRSLPAMRILILLVAFVLGMIGAASLAYLIKRHKVPEYLQNVFTLAFVLLLFSLVLSLGLKRVL